MAGLQVPCVAAAACLLLAFALPLHAQHFPGEASNHKPTAEWASANGGDDHSKPVEWRQAPPAVANKRYWKGVWIATWAAFVAVNVLDAHSSSGRYEANPLLRGNSGVFSPRRAVAVKSAGGGGFFALQCWLARKNPGENHYKTFAVATGAATGALAAVAVRNYGVTKAAGAPTPLAAPAYLLRTP
jgi:hypothetical protein